MVKLTSRKFWIALIGQMVGVLVLLYPEYESDIVQAASHASGLLLMALTGAGYIKGESLVDSARASVTTASKLILLAAMVLVATGCNAVNTARIDSEQIETTAQPASLTSLNSDGDLKASYQGVPPTGLIQDSEGTWMTTPGQGGVLTFNPQTGLVYLWSPKDARVEGVKVTPEPEPGQPSFEAQLIETNLSPVAAVYAGQFESAMDAIKDMTQAEAEARVKQLEQARLITGDVAELILTTIVPTLPLQQ